MSESNLWLSSLVDEVRERFELNRRILSFGQFVELVREHPKRHARSAVQYLHDCILHYGTTSVDEVWGKSTHYNLFDVAFDGERDRMIGHQSAQAHVVRLLENFVRTGKVDKLILLHGPNGSAKSTFVKTLMRGLEHYSTQDDGALYRFNWIFPAERMSTRGSIGFGKDAKGVELDKLDSYAFLEEAQIDAKLKGSLHDHPLLLLPIGPRQRLLDELLGGESFIPSEYLYRGDLSHTNRIIFDALLTSYKGDLGAVLKHIQVERFYISRRYRRGTVTVEPQMRVDAGIRQLTADRSLGALPPSLQNLTLFDAVGDLADANRGLIEYDDLFKRHPDLNKYLLSASERGAVSLDDRNLFLDLVMIATGNEMYLDAFKQTPEYSSFKGRIELVRLPYLLDYLKEERIYKAQLATSNFGKPVSPHTTFVISLWAVLTRLRRPNTDDYSPKLREVIDALSPIQKADLYAQGWVPESLAPERAKELRQAIPELMAEGAGTSHYEGRYGASPREMKMILLNASQNSQYPCLSPLAVLDELRELVKDKSVFPFLQIKPDGEYFQHDTFIDVVRQRYLEVLDREIQMALGLIDERQYADLFARYIDHVSQSIKKEKVLNRITGQYEQPDERFMRETEVLLAITEDPKDFRSNLISSIAAFSIENPGSRMDYPKIFPTLFQSLRRSFYEDRVKTVRNLLEHVLNTLDGQLDTINVQDRQAATDAVSRLTTELGYTAEGAREAVAFLLSNRYNQ